MKPPNLSLNKQNNWAKITASSLYFRLKPPDLSPNKKRAKITASSMSVYIKPPNMSTNKQKI